MQNTVQYCYIILFSVNIFNESLIKSVCFFDDKASNCSNSFAFPKNCTLAMARRSSLCEAETMKQHALPHKASNELELLEAKQQEEEAKSLG